MPKRQEPLSPYQLAVESMSLAGETADPVVAHEARLNAVGYGILALVEQIGDLAAHVDGVSQRLEDQDGIPAGYYLPHIKGWLEEIANRPG